MLVYGGTNYLVSGSRTTCVYASLMTVYEPLWNKVTQLPTKSLPVKRLGLVLPLPITPRSKGIRVNGGRGCKGEILRVHCTLRVNASRKCVLMFRVSWTLRLVFWLDDFIFLRWGFLFFSERNLSCQLRLLTVVTVRKERPKVSCFLKLVERRSLSCQGMCLSLFFFFTQITSFCFRNWQIYLSGTLQRF